MLSDDYLGSDHIRSSSQVDQLRHEVNALKLENEKLKKAAQERWEQDKADHHSKKGKMNRIAELKVMMFLGDALWCVVIVT